MLQMCKGDQSYKTEGDDEQVTLLSQLKKSNPEKFKRWVSVDRHKIRIISQ